jgi:hypothetical protein
MRSWCSTHRSPVLRSVPLRTDALFCAVLGEHGKTRTGNMCARSTLWGELVKVEARLEDLGAVLPAETALPPGVQIPFRWVRARGTKAFVSGHGALMPDGTPAGPFGKVPSEVSLEDAQGSARLTTLAMLSSLRRELGDLDRITS